MVFFIFKFTLSLQNLYKMKKSTYFFKNLVTSFFHFRKALVALFFVAALIIAICSCKPEPNPDDDLIVSIEIGNNY